MYPSDPLTGYRVGWKVCWYNTRQFISWAYVLVNAVFWMTWWFLFIQAPVNYAYTKWHDCMWYVNSDNNTVKLPSHCEGRK